MNDKERESDDAWEQAFGEKEQSGDIKTHSVEGMRIRCNHHGQYFGVVKNGRCPECGREVEVRTK